LISNHFGESVSGPEKAGGGGSIPSLATINFNTLATLKKRAKISRAYNTRTSVSLNFTFGVARSIDFQVSQPVLLALAMCCRTSLSSALSSLGTQDHLRVGEGSWPIVICPLRTVDLCHRNERRAARPRCLSFRYTIFS
jgi:hypothetical protein